MRKVFVDTIYFVALINPKVQWREKALKVKAELTSVQFVTSEAVLVEVLNYLCEYGENLRKQVCLFVRDALEDVDFEVVAFNETSLLEGLELYESRPDKGYSLTDCTSMNICRKLEITEVLTQDHHFKQEGFKILL